MSNEVTNVIANVLTSKSPKIDRADYMARIFTNARQHGSLSRETVELLGEIRHTDKLLVKAIGTEFKLGYVAGRLDVDRATAKTSMDKGRPSKKHPDGTDSHRSEREQKAWYNANSRWSDIMRDAGIPNQKNGAKRKPRAPKVDTKPDAKPDAKPVATLADFVLQAPKPLSVADCNALMLDHARALLTTHDRAASAPWGAYNALIADFVSKVNLISKGVSGHEVTPKAETKPVPATSEPSADAIERMAKIAKGEAETEKKITYPKHSGKPRTRRGK